MAGSRTVKALVIPEDQTYNGYILRPLVKAIMADAGRASAKVGDRRQPGDGRDLMIGESLKRLPLLYRLCPELKSLRERIAELLTDR